MKTEKNGEFQQMACKRLGHNVEITKSSSTTPSPGREAQPGDWQDAVVIVYCYFSGAVSRLPTHHHNECADP